MAGTGHIPRGTAEQFEQRCAEQVRTLLEPGRPNGLIRHTDYHLVDVTLARAYPDTELAVRLVDSNGAECVRAFALWAGDLVAGDPADEAEAFETAMLIVVNALGL